MHVTFYVTKIKLAMMKTTIRKDGNYEMFQTRKGHSVICLDNEEWFTKRENNLVKTDRTRRKSKELACGKYILIASNDFFDNEVLHLFLVKENQFEELILPSYN